uniref:Uncharacterized protein n=1 Tax=Rhizophora mucronata TaxID=61149 RepID=A0A2P2MMD9_RHIMU
MTSQIQIFWKSREQRSLVNICHYIRVNFLWLPIKFLKLLIEESIVFLGWVPRSMISCPSFSLVLNRHCSLLFTSFALSFCNTHHKEIITTFPSFSFFFFYLCID